MQPEMCATRPSARPASPTADVAGAPAPDPRSIVAFLRARLDEDEEEARASGPAVRTGPGHPERILADVQAKRRIVDEYERFVSGELCSTEQIRALRHVVRLLALPYATHPGYRADLWRP